MILRSMRFLGALAVLAVGAVHLQQYLGGDYQAIPTIGTLFLVNAIASAVVGIGLLVPVEWALAARPARATIGVLALTGVAIAVGSLIALFISESGSLFGFSEHGYRTAVVVAIIAEAATILLLAPLVASSEFGSAAMRRLRAPAARVPASRHRVGRGRSPTRSG